MALWLFGRREGCRNRVVFCECHADTSKWDSWSLYVRRAMNIEQSPPDRHRASDQLPVQVEPHIKVMYCPPVRAS